MKLKPSTALCFLSCLSLCQNAQAQDASRLAITVHGKPQPVKVENQEDDKEDLRRIPGSASIVDRRQWQAQRAATIKDLTDYIPGVYTQPRNGAESSRLSIRGSGLANTFQGRGMMVMQDGIPINMADGEFEFPVIDPWLIDYARIMPGANALAEGASTLGGAIDFITPTGASSEGYTLKGEAGSFGTLHSFASVGKTFSNGDIFASGSAFDQAGYRANNEQDTSHLNANIGWQQNDELSQRIIINHTVSHAEIPGALSRAQMSADPQQSNPSNLLNHYQRDLDITRIAHRSAWESGSDRLETTLYYTYRALDNPVTTYIVEDNNDFGMRAKYTHQSGLDKQTIGINLGYGTQDESRYANVNANKGNHILDRDLDALTSEVYVQYDKNIIGRLYGIGGVQASYNTRNIEETSPAQAEQDNEYFGYNPRIGLRYDLDATTQIFTNLSRSFEPPTWAELSGGNNSGFNDLDAQTATTLEFGGRGEYNHFQWSAAAYRSYLKNEFVNYRFADGSTDTINADKSIHDGLEIGFGGKIAENIFSVNDGLQFKLAYTWSRFHLDGDALYGDNQLPGMPEHYLRSEILYQHSSGFSFGPNIELAPSGYPVDLTNSLKAGGYAVYGARMAWINPSGNIETFVEGRNLTDRTYIATTNVVPDAAGNDGRYFYPGEGRAVYAGLRLKF